MKSNINYTIYKIMADPKFKNWRHMIDVQNLLGFGSEPYTNEYSKYYKWIYTGQLPSQKLDPDNWSTNLDVVHDILENLFYMFDEPNTRPKDYNSCRINPSDIIVLDYGNTRQAYICLSAGWAAVPEFLDIERSCRYNDYEFLDKLPYEDPAADIEIPSFKSMDELAKWLIDNEEFLSNQDGMLYLPESYLEELVKMGIAEPVTP